MTATNCSTSNGMPFDVSTGLPLMKSASRLARRIIMRMVDSGMSNTSTSILISSTEQYIGVIAVVISNFWAGYSFLPSFDTILRRRTS